MRTSYDVLLGINGTCGKNHTYARIIEWNLRQEYQGAFLCVLLLGLDGLTYRHWIVIIENDSFYKGHLLESESDEGGSIVQRTSLVNSVLRAAGGSNRTLVFIGTIVYVNI